MEKVTVFGRTAIIVPDEHRSAILKGTGFICINYRCIDRRVAVRIIIWIINLHCDGDKSKTCRSGIRTSEGANVPGYSTGWSIINTSSCICNVRESVRNDISNNNPCQSTCSGVLIGDCKCYLIIPKGINKNLIGCLAAL